MNKDYWDFWGYLSLELNAKYLNGPKDKIKKNKPKIF